MGPRRTGRGQVREPELFEANAPESGAETAGQEPGLTERIQTSLRDAARNIRERPLPAHDAWVTRFATLTEGWSEGTRTYVALLAAALAGRVAYPDAELTRLKRGEGPFHLRGAADAIGKIRGVLRLDLGANGANPLNNGAFQGPDSLSLVPVRRGNRRKFGDLLEIIGELPSLSDDDASHALRAFVQVRTREATPIQTLAASRLPLGRLVAILHQFVSIQGDGGARAQVVAAGVLSAAYGSDRVRSGFINNDDRNYPGDVALLEDEGIQSVFEVRQKLVSIGDLITFLEKVSARGIRRAAILGIARGQDDSFREAAAQRATEAGVFLRVFPDWESFVEDCIAHGSSDPWTIISEIPPHVFVWAQQLRLPPRSVAELRDSFWTVDVAL